MRRFSLRLLSLAVVSALLLSLSGCAALKTKFTRKKKRRRRLFFTT